MTDGGSDTFTRDLFAWQAQVLADRKMTLLALHVALIIGQHVNRQTGEAWPSQETIAAALSISSDGVRKAVRQLVDNGHLKVAIRHGRGESNRYRLVLKTQLASGVSEERNPDDGLGICAENPASQRGFQERNPDDQPKETQTAVPLNHLNEPSEEESLFPEIDAKPAKARTRRVKPIASASDFDEAYGLYPRHVAPDAARKAYASAIGRGATPTEILAGIQRYAIERAGQSERYTAHMASWLNAGRYRDAPSQQHSNNNGNGFSGLHLAMTLMEPENV